MIADYIKRLRRAADVLEELLSADPLSNPKAARAIAQRLPLDLRTQDTPPATDPRKGRSYNGQHWTQKPENRARVIAAAKHRAAGPAAPAQAEPPPATKTRHYEPGQHWTQRPENRAKLARMIAKSTKTAKRKRKQTPPAS